MPGMVWIVSRTLSGLFLAGAVNRLRKRKRTDREIPGHSPDKSGKSGKNRESPKKDKKDKLGRTSPDRDALPFEPPPRLAALEKKATGIVIKCHKKVAKRRRLLRVFFFCFSSLSTVPSWFSPVHKDPLLILEDRAGSWAGSMKIKSRISSGPGIVGPACLHKFAVKKAGSFFFFLLLFFTIFVILLSLLLLLLYILTIMMMISYFIVGSSILLLIIIITSV